MSFIGKSQTVRFLPFLLILFLSFSLVAAHEEAVTSLDDTVKSSSMKVTLAAIVAITVLIAFATLYKKGVEKNNSLKVIVFTLIVIVTLATTFYIAGSTIRLNIISETGGPVHWHADFEIWNCDTKLDLTDPHGLANRVGTSTFHEHGDDRIHLEGVVVNKENVNLHNFFHVVGATLKDDSLAIPTVDGMLEVKNGNTCNDAAGKLQVFVYKITNPDERGAWTYEQTKLNNFNDYVISPHSNVPPADCIIIEFDNEKATTDRICETYRLAIDRGDLRGG